MQLGEGGNSITGVGTIVRKLKKVLVNIFVRLDSNPLEYFSAKEVFLDDIIEIKDKEYKQDKQVVCVR